ncbi:MAG: hypothetical protein ABI130_03650 [Leifsonia sp.]
MKTRKRLWIVITAFATALGLGVGITAAVMLVQAREAAQPVGVVSAYLSHVQRGEITAAMRMEGRAAKPTEILLTDKAYRQATDRMTGYSILGTQTVGTTSEVRVRIQQKSGSSTATFELAEVKNPISLLGITVWRLKPVVLESVAVTLGAPGRIDATLSGVPLGWKGATVNLHAFPGRYSLAIKSQSPWYTLPGGDIPVEGFSGDNQFMRTATLTAKGQDAATAAANAWFDKCTADPDFHPAGCSFSLTSGANPGEVWTNQSWQVQTRPTIKLGDWAFDCPVSTPSPEIGCWNVTSAPPGLVNFHANYSIPATGETGDVTSTGPIQAKVEGWITSFTDAGAVFTSTPWNN